MTALTQSFSQQYEAYNLVIQLSALSEAASAVTTPTAGGCHCIFGAVARLM